MNKFHETCIDCLSRSPGWSDVLYKAERQNKDLKDYISETKEGKAWLSDYLIKSLEHCSERVIQRIEESVVRQKEFHENRNK